MTAPNTSAVHEARSQGPGTAILRSLRARALSLPLSAGAGLIMASFVIDEAGPGAYGYVTLIATMFLVLPFAELGVQAAITSSIAEADDPSTDTHVVRVLVTALRVLIVSASAVIAVSVALGVTGLWSGMLGIPAGVFPDADLVVTVTVCTYAVGLPAGIGVAILWGLDRNVIAVWMSVITPVSALGICLVLRAMSVTPLWYAVAQTAGFSLCAVATLVVAALIGRFDLRTLLAAVPRRRSRPGLRIRTTAGPAFVVLIAMPLLLQSDRVVLAHRGTPDALAVLGLAAQLYAPLWTVAYTAGQPLWPQFSQRRVAGENLSAVWGRGVALLSLLAVALGAGMVLLGTPVTALVSDGAVVGSTFLFAFLGIQLLAQSAHMPAWMCLTTPEGLRFHAGCVVAAVGVKLTVAWIVTPDLGAIGPVVGSIAGITVCMLVPGMWAVHRRWAR